MLVFHYDVEQDNRYIIDFPEKLLCLLAGVGTVESQLIAGVGDVAEGELGDRVHLLFVVYDEDVPAGLFVVDP